MSIILMRFSSACLVSLLKNCYLLVGLVVLTRYKQGLSQPKELEMQALIINFNLDGITRSDYEGVCNELAPAFAAVPGLISKHWLADEANNTYGGIYLFQDQAALDGYLASELFAGVGGNPALANATAKPFSILEGPTRVTRGI